MSIGASIRNALKAGGMGALSGSLGGALAVSAWDGAHVLAAGGGARALIAVLATAFVVTTIGALIAGGIALASRSVLALFERLGIDWMLMLSALATSTLAVLGAQAAVLVVLSGAGIRTAAIALSAALGVALGAVITLGLRALAARAGWQASITTRSVAFLVGSLATLISTVYFAPGLVEELDVPVLLSLGLPLVTGAIGALIGIERRVLVRGALGAWLLLGLLAIAHATLHSPAAARRHIARETYSARTVLNWIYVLTQPPLAPLKPGTGTCRPTVRAGVLKGKAAVAREGAPNIVVVTSDAVRWDHTSLSGYARDTTPNLERWAKSAAVFSSAHTPASSTRQTFRALFTGLFPTLIAHSSASQWWGVSLPPKQVSLAERLKHAGYRTISSSPSNKIAALKGFDASLPKVARGRNAAEDYERTTRAQLDNILKELRKPDRKKPVFTWAHLLVTHQPYKVTTRSKYGPAEVDAYDWAIRYVDGEMNRFLEALRGDPKLQNTYVFFSADHGQAFNEHGNRHHGFTAYQEETRVPFVAWGPDVQPGVRPEPVSTLDLVPTLLELGSAPPGRELCGTSILPWLRDAKESSSRPVYIEQFKDPRGGFAVAYIKGRYKLVLAPTRGTRELFDIAADPFEMADLSGDRQDIVQQLAAELAAFQRARGMDPASYGLR